MVVYEAEDPALRLARRLKSLRTAGLAEQRITQRQLSEAIGASGPLISSWEKSTDPVCPPAERLKAYATFFATERSVEQRRYRVLEEAELTAEERARRDELLHELVSLRDEVQGDGPASPLVADPFVNSHWRFPRGEPITIVCSVLPPEYLKHIPYGDRNAADHVELYKYADLDALLELFGHLRAANPRNKVQIRAANDLRGDDFRAHLVLLGGVDWNEITPEVLRRLKVPVRQLERPTEAESGGFEVGVGESRKLFRPELRKKGNKSVLVKDVAHFVRARNPYNDKRTVTICNGMYARGTYGAVRALTDDELQDRNEQYLRTRFAGVPDFSILCMVEVISGEVVTPDWSKVDVVLHEWPEPAM